MTLQEAANSKKDFKRPHHKDWLFIDTNGVITWTNGIPAYFTLETLNAKDFVVRK